MIATRTQNDASSRSRIAEVPSTRQTPPSERDFELYLALTAETLSTRAAAERFGISQTRVLQVRDRVAEWLGAGPPPLARLDPQRRVRLVGEAAMRRMEFLLSQAVEAWHASKGTTTKVRAGESFNEVTTTYTTQGDIRYLIGASRLNDGTLKLAEGLEAALARVADVTRTEHPREDDASRSPHASPEGDCSRDEGEEAGARLAAGTHADANDGEAESCDECAERRRQFLAAIADNTAPVQPPRTDANGMLMHEAEDVTAEEDLSLLPLARASGSAPSLTLRASTSRPLSRKERRARKRQLEKLRRKVR